MTTPLKITKVTKHYGHSKKAAVHELSLAIQPGEVYGLLGTNGAGKTTTIRMILDFIRPSSGTIKLFGKDNTHDAVELHQRIGYLPGDVVLPKGVTGNEFLTYLGKLSGTNIPDYRQELARRFEAQLDKKMQQLSKGNRQKIGIIQAFMHQPDLLILDEPTSGLDPLMQEQFYLTVNEARKRGAAILLSSHSFEEVERICDRIGIVRDGKFVYEGKASDILASKKPRWHITFADKHSAAKLRSNPALTVINATPTSLTVEPATSIEQALSVLSHHAILSMSTSQTNLENEFLHFYEEDTV